MHLTRWCLVVNLHVLVTACAIQCGALGAIYISAHRFRQDSECPLSPLLCGEDSDVLVVGVWAIMSTTSSIVWYYCSVFWQLRTAGPPPKPQMDSFVVRDVLSECGNSPCAICLDEFSLNCRAARLPCNHVFHDECVRGWLSRGRPKVWCPMRCSAVPPVTAGRATAIGWPESQSTSQGTAVLSPLPLAASSLGSRPVVFSPSPLTASSLGRTTTTQVVA